MDIFCNDNLLFDTIILINNESVKYKIIAFGGDDKNIITAATIILPDFSKSSNNKIIDGILREIGHKFNINRFCVFNDCLAYRLICKPIKLKRKQYDYVEEHYLGFFDLAKK